MLETRCFSSHIGKVNVLGQDGMILKSIGRLVYVVHDPIWENKCHINQLQQRYVKDQTKQEIQMPFEVPIPQSVTTEERHEKKERNPTELLHINPKSKKYISRRK